MRQDYINDQGTKLVIISVVLNVSKIYVILCSNIFNRIAFIISQVSHKRGDLSKYLLKDLLRKEAKLIKLQVRLVLEEMLTRNQRIHICRLI